MTTTTLRITLAAGLCWAFVLGCEKPPSGPKRSDHKDAHTARYHPAVRRSQTTASATPVAPSGANNSAAPSATRPANATAGPVGTPVLFVNDDVIAIQDVLEPIRQDLLAQSQQLGARDYADYLLRIVSDELRRQISTIVVYQKAKADFPEDAKEMLDKKASELIDNVINTRFGAVRARYEEHLESLDLTMDDMKQRARRQILVSQFMQDRLTPMLQEPPRHELLKLYNTRIDAFTTTAKAELFLIEIPLADELGKKPLERATAQELADVRQQARGQLERAREELDSGVEFGAVARRYSKGIRKADGGAWGEISPGSLTKRWQRPAEVLFTLESGQVSDITETDASLFIVKAGQVTPRHCQSFAEAQLELIRQAKDEQYQRLSNRYLVELMTRATIDAQQQQNFFRAVVAAAPRPTPPGAPAKR